MRPFWFRVKTGRRSSVYVKLEATTPGVRGVWVVQQRLRVLGLLPGDDFAAVFVNGQINRETRAAVRRFQKLAGLPVNGDPHDARMRLALRDAVRSAAQAGAIPPTP